MSLKVLAAATIIVIALNVCAVLNAHAKWEPVIHRQHGDSRTVSENLADIAWIVSLCLFSILIRSRKNLKLRFVFIGVFLLALAALHSHSLWSFVPLQAKPLPEQGTVLKKLRTVSVGVTETGLRMDDAITFLSFDNEHRLWLGSSGGGPYLYITNTNEVANLLRPDLIYGMNADPQGMWVLTSNGAFLYSGEETIRHVRFPEGVIPLSAIRMNEELYFGTTRGLYLMEEGELILVANTGRTTRLSAQPDALLMLADSGIWQVTNSRITKMNAPDQTFYGLLATQDRIFTATDSIGIVLSGRSGWEHIVFAKETLNMISPEAVTLHKTLPCFGTLDGSVIFYQNGEWLRVAVSEWPITSLASDGKSLYAWSNGRLLSLNL